MSPHTSRPGDARPGARAESHLPFHDGEGPLRLFWGDLHNHNAVGYAKGSLERSIDLAREHLDFFAFTGHASWHDLPVMPGERHLKWVRGFEVHTEHWPKTRRLIREANDESFVAFAGYEWHSSEFGDYCVIFPGDDNPLFLPDHADKLLEFAAVRGALAIPHHVAYRQGWRGANWQHYRSAVSPVVEIFSEHGCTESDRAPFPMIRHSNGGRWTANTISRQLQRGLRFGFVASSDDHLGYPGAYGEGVLGVWAEELSREAILAAIRERRTYAATGERIVLEVAVNGRPMGAELPLSDDREIDVRVEAPDSIETVELVRSGRVIERHFPEDDAEPPRLPGRVRCRLQFGWGPWADLALGRICDWNLTVRIAGGRIERAWPCFQAAPFDEDRRDRLRLVSEREASLQSSTTRVGAFGEDPTKSVTFEFDAAADAQLEVELVSPVNRTIRAPLAELLEGNVVEFTGPFTSESLIVGRLVGPAECEARLRWHDRGSVPDWYYVRVRLHNGHMAWSSPVWVG
ncbi:MAG: DUF3604 domain-containing protein [Planctomycetes bacterium]|nr:DUF3604 domain-containing protein [Planctomycetota bacterium]